MTETIPITIIGGGAVGSAIAYELSKDLEGIVLLERSGKNRMENQSTRNSGVIHAGIYYKAGSLMAELCVQGNKLLYEFCREYGVPHKNTGKLVVASKPWQVEYLLDTEAKAKANGVPGVRMLDEREAKQFEPNVSCEEGALYVPTSGVVEPVSLFKAYQRLAADQGAVIQYGNKVVGVEPLPQGFRITTETPNGGLEIFDTELLINAAGLFSDEIARLFNPESSYTVLPTRGEAAKFERTRREDLWLNGMNVYPAPYMHSNETGEVLEIPLAEAEEEVRAGRATKTVGVHLTPTLGDAQGNYFDEAGQAILSSTVTIGPAKTSPVEKDDYRPIRDSEYYHERARPFFSGLRLDDIELHQTGNMARLVGSTDWHIAFDPVYKRCLNLFGIGSPGLTGSQAIGKRVRGMIGKK